MPTAPQEPCIHCGRRITFDQWFTEECPNNERGYLKMHRVTSSDAGPPLHVPCYQCEKTQAAVEYLNIDGALEPFCENCYWKCCEVMADYAHETSTLIEAAFDSDDDYLETRSYA